MTKPRSRSLTWSPRALSNLEAITDRLDEESASASDRFLQELFEAVEALKAFPQMGRIPTDYDWRASGFTELRELLIGSYRVAYAVEPRRIQIVYLVHARRRFPPLD